MSHFQKAQINKKTFVNLKSACLVAATVLAIGSMYGGYFYTVSADEYDEQIKALKNQNSQYNKEASNLRKKADSLAKEIAVLDQEKRAIQAEIKKTNTEIGSLKKQIVKIKQEIEANKQALGEVIAEIYLQSQVSDIERLASSKDITDYLDEEVVRNNVQRNLSKKLAEIKAQKKQLETSKVKLETKLKSQQAKRESLAAKERQKQAILTETKGDEAAYKRLAAKNNSKISELREQQRIANLSYASGSSVTAGSPGHGGYPAYLDYPNAQDSKVDPWGMYNRECVSYTAWRVHQKTGNMPYWGGRGNANQWPSSAQADGIPTGSTPRPQSVAIWMSGYYGHAMWVEYIKPNGMVHVSQYNYAIDGLYSEMDINPNSAIYIYF